MNTEVISNGAMNYENAHQRFKISKLEMKVEDDHLYVEISSPLLSGTNHSIRVLEDRLRLRITHLKDVRKTILLPLECDLFLPKQGYTTIIKEKVKRGLITLKLTKAASELSDKSFSHQYIA